ncbi:ornithine cyclodeaminase family protein [Micromonospora sp. HUAS LYJ1]|uniref:ornithine cyclodeaminase family protein n=1 Tax=Micromonospora sp. HUAS LYJ1 TaxID=3061626 RepID=UPI00267210EF|nr:ornithine cyclodeaminase family protein [Micromonospora sp. HUAS LYJ1]WKU02939.1 ornithine cyclodeaminase family protein [Micromonospora sp. HUAS LYJ1]
MSWLSDEHQGADFLYLTRADVAACCAQVDVVGAVQEALVAHTRGETLLPDEAYLGWPDSAGNSARCLAMPGGLRRDGGWVVGLKTINGSLGNVGRGIPRSQGFTLLFDPDTARPTVLMEAAYVSALRTAAVTAVSARHLGRARVTSMALIGCGTLAKAHLALLPDACPDLAALTVFDTDPQRAELLAKAARGEPNTAHLEIRVAADARECVREADLVVTTTTVTEGYLPFDWLRPGALVAHVSLDDVLPDVVAQADLVLVDDWSLVSHDHRRLLGRMYREGTLLAPDGGHHPGCVPRAQARRVDGSLGDVIVGDVPGRTRDTDIVLSNPFGMAVLDVAVAARVQDRALAVGLGRRLPV